ncbi:MAG: hypothetical protein IID53_14455 [Proteobacteria bacterium]|nr:hypothetical protein [Pseudomonadota bacterium]
MPKLSRRETLARGGAAVAAAAVLPFIPAIAHAKEDAEILRAEAALLRLRDEINAGLHRLDGNVPDEATERGCALENVVAYTPAKSLEGVAAKLRLAAYWIVAEEKDDVEDRCALSALETVERLAGRRI